MNLQALYFNLYSWLFQFTCGGVDVDILFSYDWDTDEARRGGYNALYDLTCKQETLKGKQWFALGSARLQKKFITDQPNEVSMRKIISDD